MTRGRKPTLYPKRSLTVALDPALVAEIERYAHKAAGDNVSLLGRWGWNLVLRRMRRLGPRKLKIEIQNSEKGETPGSAAAGKVNSLEYLNIQPLEHESTPTNTKGGEHPGDAHSN